MLAPLCACQDSSGESPRMMPSTYVTHRQERPVPGKARERGVRLSRARLPSEPEDSASPWEEAPRAEVKGTHETQAAERKPSRSAGGC
ncbi:unnamed protein product [Coccothraustes coccothraustes]